MTSFEHWFRLSDGDWTDKATLKFSPYDNNHKEVVEYLTRLTKIYDVSNAPKDIDAWADLFERGLQSAFDEYASGVFVSDNRESLEIDCVSKKAATDLRRILSELLNNENRVVSVLQGSPV